MRIYIKVLFFLFTVIPLIGHGQEKLNEEEVNLQKIFIEANQQKLLGKYKSAISLYREVLKEDRENAAAYYELARIHDIQNEGLEAIKAIQAAISIDRQNDWYKKFLADLYQKNGKNKEAAAIYEELTEQHPENEYYYLKWGYFLVKANDIKKALKIYDQLEKQVGINEEIIRRKHSLYLGIGDNKKAGKELLKLIGAFPENINYKHLLANFYIQTNEHERAKDIYKDILQISPEDSKAKIGLVGNNKKANDDIGYLQSLMPIFNSEDVELDMKIGKLMPFITKVAETNDKELAATALELADILEKVHPEEAKVMAAKGDLYYHSRDMNSARQMYEKTLALDDGVFPVWQQLLFLLLEQKDFPELEKKSEQAIDNFPNKAILYFLLGHAQLEQQKPGAAAESLQTALMMSNRIPQLKHEVLVRLGQVYHLQKKYVDSDKAFEGALKLVADAPEALRRYSYCLAERKEKLEMAEEMAISAVKQMSGDPAFEANYGWVLYKMGDYKKAKNRFDIALKTGGNKDSLILEHYGDTLFQLNDIENAMLYWQQAKENGRHSELLDKKIANRQLYE